MKRRTMISVTAGTGISMLGAGLWHFNNGEERDIVTKSELPEGSNLELARSFAEEMHEYFPSCSVFIADDATIAMRYESDANSKSALETELYSIADKFATHASEHGSDTLTILVDKVQMIVPNPTVQAYIEGEINQEAFFKTLQVNEANYND